MSLSSVQSHQLQEPQGTVLWRLLTLFQVKHIASDDIVLLQSSLTGNGARISVICTVTPASSQAEETHNTLKFATRAKKVEITAQRNEIVDQASLIRRYQEEILTLRSQLDTVTRERGGQIPMPVIHDPLHPEVGVESHGVLSSSARHIPKQG